MRPLDDDIPGSENRTAFLFRRGVLGGGNAFAGSSCLVASALGLLRRVRRSAMGRSRSAIAGRLTMTRKSKLGKSCRQKGVNGDLGFEDVVRLYIVAPVRKRET